MSLKPEIPAVEALAHAARERLAFIEYRAYFCGLVQRQDLEAAFSISEPAATRDLRDYRRLAPGNLRYDAAARAYVPEASFEPLFPFHPERVMGWLSSGFIHGLSIGQARRPVPTVRAIELGLPDLKVLAAVTRAIHNRRAIDVSYVSFSSGETRRQLVPHAIVDNGIRWHVRAFDRARNRFGDFVIARIADAVDVDGERADGEGVLADHQWNRMVDLELVPHPGLRHPEVVVREFGLTDGALRKRCRGAVVGYLLRLWGVDCSPDHCFEPTEHYLWLRNPETLYGVDSAELTFRGRNLRL